MGNTVIRHTEIFDKFMVNIDRLNTILIFAELLTSKEIEMSDTISKKMNKKTDIEKINSILKMPEEIKIEFTEEQYKRVLESNINYRKNISELMPFLRNQVLIFVVSLFDYYIMDLIWNYHWKYPMFLKNSNKNITYKELYEYQLLDEIFEKLILKEVDKVGHGSYDEMIDYIKNVLGLSLLKYQKINNKVIEVRETRNILIHNNGIINEQYIKNTKIDEIYLNDKIGLNNNLLNKYIKILTNGIEIIDKEAKKKLFKDEITYSIYHN